MVSVTVVKSHIIVNPTSYIVDFEDCQIYKFRDIKPGEYLTYWWDTWYFSWGLVGNMPGNDRFDGSNFNDYETPYSVTGPPTGHCPCRACAGDRFACSTQLATAVPIRIQY